MYYSHCFSKGVLLVVLCEHISKFKNKEILLMLFFSELLRFISDVISYCSTLIVTFLRMDVLCPKKSYPRRQSGFCKRYSHENAQNVFFFVITTQPHYLVITSDLSF